MSQIVLFHSAQGLRRDVSGLAARLRDAGHEVWTPDLFDGATFERLEDGIAHRDEIGIPALIERAATILEGLPTELVYAGFSMGAASAGYFAAARPGARGALLMHGATPLAAFGVSAWPGGVPAQVHYAADDPFVDAEGIDAFANVVREAGSPIEVFTYPGSGHLFADPDGPDYDEESAELMLERGLAFVGDL